MNSQTYKSKSRLLAKLVWELLMKAERFESLADLTDALKWRCGQLRVKWTNDDISGAYRLIASNTPLPGGLKLRLRLEERPLDYQPISRSEASDILKRLGVL